MYVQRLYIYSIKETNNYYSLKLNYIKMRIENGRLVVRTSKKVAYIGFVRGEFRVKICGLVNEGDYVREHLIVLKEYSQAFRVVKLLNEFNVSVDKNDLKKLKTA